MKASARSLAFATTEQPDLVLDAEQGVCRVKVVPLSEVQMSSVDWLWPSYLPLGKLVVLDGFPGQGKSTVLIDVAARGSRGWAMPDARRGCWEAWDTLILTYEDDAADTLRPRLEAAGGDASRVHHIVGIAYNDNEELVPPSLPKDLAALDQILAERPDIRLLIIDPLAAALGAEVDSHRDQDMRRVLARLARIAAERAVCIVVIRHVRKSPGANAITAGGGSIGIIGQARVGLLVDRHPEEADVAVLACAKSNVGPMPASLRFRKMPVTVDTPDGESIETLKLEWLGEALLSADELLAGREDAPGEGRDAAEWLRQVLGTGKLERRTLMKAATDAGFPERTVDRAGRRIGVIKQREGFGAEMRSFWALGNASSSATDSSLPPVPPRKKAGGNGGSGGVLATLDEAEVAL